MIAKHAGAQAIKRILGIILRIAVSGALMFFIVRKAGADNVMRNLRSMHGGLFLLTAMIYIVIAWLVAIRWSMLLDNRYSVRKLFSLQMIGNFFNNVLPSAIGGDAVRFYYLFRETGNGGVSFGSVFLDRFLGLFARLSLGLASGLIAYAELKSVRMHLAIPAFFAFLLVAAFFLFRFRLGLGFAGVAHFYEYVLDRVRRPDIMVKGFLLSLLIQALLILMVYFTARGIGQELSFIGLFVFVPIIITLFIVPASLSGLGVREGAFVVLFGLIGIPASVSVSISFLWFLSMAAASLVGLVEYVRYKKRPLSPGLHPDLELSGSGKV